MPNHAHSKPAIPRSASAGSRKLGFTLIEVVLVLVLLLIISGITLPYFAGSLRGTKLRTASRTIERITNYAHTMAIMREETMTVVLNHETMELFAGGSTQTSTNAVDGELDQEALKNLGYVKSDTPDGINVEKEVHRMLPDSLTVKDFEKEWTEEDDQYKDLYLINFYPNGQCDWFKLELEDNHAMGVKMENDPVSARVHTEFTQ